eukprot:scaffold7453_cov177-Amphora_coffeaeformis.AAC.2
MLMVMYGRMVGDTHSRTNYDTVRSKTEWIHNYASPFKLSCSDSRNISFEMSLPGDERTSGNYKASAHQILG